MKTFLLLMIMFDPQGNAVNGVTHHVETLAECYAQKIVLEAEIRAQKTWNLRVFCTDFPVKEVEA